MSHTTTLAALQRDQAQLDATDSRISQWTSTHPCLAGARTGADIMAMIQGRQDTIEAGARGRMECNNEVLYAMLELAARDPEAGRVVLHAMQPLIISSARRAIASYASYEDALSAAIAAMWETICAFPLHRAPRKALANLRGDFLKRLCGKKAIQEADGAFAVEPQTLEAIINALDDTELDVVAGDPEDVELAAIAGLESPVDQMSGVELLAVGVDVGAITRGEAQLLIELCIDHADVTQVSQRLGISAAALRQRKSRALRRLGTWAKTSS